MSLPHYLAYLAPWEPSPSLVIVFALTTALYLAGVRRTRVSRARQIAFWTGLALFYVSLHTRLDYYAEHQFFVHRIQHLVLHHLAPLVMMASFPGPVLFAGLPLRHRQRLRRAARSPAWRLPWRCMTQPLLVTVVFVAAILVWLIPSVQFVAMLDWRLYRFMNWSVAVTGMFYWWMLLDHRPAPPARMVAGMRVLSPVITMAPQILAGAIITFTQHDLYPIFDICGRAFTFPVLVDQSIGGLIMWVPAAMLEAIGGLMALRTWMRLSQNPRHRSFRQRRAGAGAPAAVRSA
jgi:putative membrane protein